MRCFRELTLTLFACGLMSAPIDEDVQTLLNDSGIQQFLRDPLLGPSRTFGGI